MMLLRLGLAVATLSLVSCTADNPLYSPERTGDLGSLPSGDLAGQKPGDLAGVPDKADLAQPNMSCTGDERGCLAGASARCEAGMLKQDRQCPMSSQCQSGYCQPPAPSSNNVGKACSSMGIASEALCVNGISGGGTTAPSCQPFFVAGTSDPKWVCAAPIGAGLPGIACTQGSQCRSGFCGSNGTCFRACFSVGDCPTSGNVNWKCVAVNIAVEGRSVSAQSCVPAF
jgi:hypothetical protein